MMIHYHIFRVVNHNNWMLCPFVEIISVTTSFQTLFHWTLFSLMMVQKLVAVLVPVTVDADVANQCVVHHVVAAEVVDVVADAAVECADRKIGVSSKFKRGIEFAME